MPRAEEIAKAMAEMDRYNQPRATVVEERYEKRVASVGGSYGGLAELMSQGRPGNWASDHKAEAEKYAGWHYVAISAIGKAIRSCDVEAYQEPVREYSKAYNAEDDDSAPLPKWHPLMKILKRPSASQSGASFREEVAIQLCLTGSALIWNVPNQMGRTVERYIIPTAIAEPRQPEKGLPKGGWYINPEVARWQVENGWFLYTGLAQAIGKVIDARDVQVIRFIHPTFKDEGQSPVSAGALWTDTSEKIDVSRHAHLRNGSDPSVIIGIDGVEDESTLQRMSAKFNEKYAGPSKHGKAMFVNGQNVKVEPVTRTPAEMAYEGAFAQFRDAIMALHGVTPIAAGIEAPSGDDGLYAPLKQFIAGTVQPILDLMAEEDTEQLASQFGEGITVFYTARAIDDAKLTEQQINTDIAAGAIEVDEIRKLRGRKPWGGEKGKAVAGQGPKQEGPGGLPGLNQGVPGLEPQSGSQALDPSKPAQPAKTPEQIAEEAVAKALAAFEDRISGLLKSGSDCGANGPGGGGFQPGNSCASGDGAGGGSDKPEPKRKPRQIPEAVDGTNPKQSRFIEDIRERAKEIQFADSDQTPNAVSDEKVFEELSNRSYDAYSESGEEELGIDEARTEAAESIMETILATAEEADPFYDNKTKVAEARAVVEEMLSEQFEGYDLAESVRQLDVAEIASRIGLKDQAYDDFVSSLSDSLAQDSDSIERDFNRYIEDHRQSFTTDWENDNYSDVRDELISQSGVDPSDLDLDTWYKIGTDNVLNFRTNSGAEYSISIDENSTVPNFNLPKNSTVGTLVFSDEEGRVRITGENAAKGKQGRNEQMQVFRGVSSAVLAQMETGNFDALYYTAAEPSRQQLYDKLTQTIAQASPKYVAVVFGGEGSGGPSQAAYLVTKRENKENLERQIRALGSNLNVSWLVKSYPSGVTRYSRDGRSVVLYDFFKSSACGANAQGGGGFQPGNTCGKRDGSAGESQGGGARKVNAKVLAWAKEKFGDEKVAENFARWFGDSKVVDDDGNPQVVYHGTPVKFTEFVGRSRHSAQFKEEVGTTFFTADKDMGRGYAGGRNEPMSVYLNMQNPHVYDANGKWWTSVNFRAIKAAREGGNDGVIIRNVIDTPAGQPQRPHDVYITFKPTQIKSATGNSGTFDPDNPNITKSAPSEGYRPPVSAQSNARKVLRWKREHGDAVQGMTATGWARARQLASGKKVSRETVGRMAAFARHRKNSKVNPKFRAEPWRDAGYVAWLGWGGDSGINWAAGIVAGEGKSGSDCGANQPGGGGFRAGNTCGKEDGGSGDSGSSKVRQWAEKKFKDKQTAENFARWFGDSKVVDEKGEPLVMYHGTTGDFTEFNPRASVKSGTEFGNGIYLTTDPERAALYANDDGGSVKPLYVRAENPVDRDGQLTEAQAGAISKVLSEDILPEDLSYHTSSREKKVFANKDEARAFYEKQRQEWESSGEGVSRYKPSVSRADQAGKDSVFTVEYSSKEKVSIMRGGRDAISQLMKTYGNDYTFALSRAGIDAVKVGDIYVVTSPNQIKSATGNSGAFSPDSSDITKSSGCGANAQGGGGFQPGNTCASGDGANDESGEDYRGSHRAPGRDSGAPLHDVTGNGEYYPDDIYGPKAVRLYNTGSGNKEMDAKSIKIIQSLRGKPDAEVTIYRAVPKDAGDKINPGDWVTINREYATMHGEGALRGEYRILELKARAADIYGSGDSIHEYGYDPAERSKSGSDCGANAEGGGGFQPGNSCGKRAKKGAKQEKPSVKAKTIKEAENFALENGLAEKVNYKKLELAIANEVNETLLKLKEQYGLTYDEITSTKRRNETAATNNTRFKNGEYVETILELNFAGMASLARDNVDFINKDIKDAGNHIAPSDDDVTILNKLKHRKTPYNVCDTVKEPITGTIAHEYGHLLTIPTDSLESAVNQQKKLKYLGDSTISRYAGTHGDERLAEIFALHFVRPDEVPSKEKEFFNKFSKVKI